MGAEAYVGANPNGLFAAARGENAFVHGLMT